MIVDLILLGLAVEAVSAASSSSSARGKPSGLALTYTCPASFPTGIFSSYYPVPSGQLLQPVLVDTIARTTYAKNLTSPTTIPTVNNVDPVFYQPSQNITTNYTTWNAAYNAILDLNRTSTADNCTKCQNSLVIAQQLAKRNGSAIPQLAIALCQAFKFKSNSSCVATYTGSNMGAAISQVLSFANLTNGLDAPYMCQTQLGFCSEPATQKLNLTKYVDPKVTKRKTAHKASGKRARALWFSDYHIDPRYQVGSEANCTSGLCCRAGNPNTASPNVSLSPASRWGAFACDVPLDFGVASLQAMAAIANKTHDLTIFTGDIVSHDQNPALSRDYVTYSEKLAYDLFAKYLGPAPLYAVESNHDTYPIAYDLARSAPGNLSEAQFGWNYRELSSLWKNHGWLDAKHAEQARTHYSAYSVKTKYNLRVIALNLNSWYTKTDLYNLYQMQDLDRLQQFSFLAQELAAAEKANERVWITGHEFPGWDGTASAKDQTNLLYALVERYSTTVAAVLTGHSHEDFFSIYYRNNGSDVSAAGALVPSITVPSITPLTNLNAGFRIMEFDTGSGDIYESWTWYSNVTMWSNSSAPVFQYEYSLREAYDPNNTWPSTAPLNASFYHRVTENMRRDPSLIDKFQRYQGKSSDLTGNCTSTACRNAKLCYMRSASSALSRNCTAGYGSVQGKGS
ncbi:hypothetical protein PYCC9005_005674 [Savitreella phatthalungensis]